MMTQSLFRVVRHRHVSDCPRERRRHVGYSSDRKKGTEAEALGPDLSEEQRLMMAEVCKRFACLGAGGPR